MSLKFWHCIGWWNLTSHKTPCGLVSLRFLTPNSLGLMGFPVQSLISESRQLNERGRTRQGLLAGDWLFNKKTWGKVAADGIPRGGNLGLILPNFLVPKIDPSLKIRTKFGRRSNENKPPCNLAFLNPKLKHVAEISFLSCWHLDNTMQGRGLKS